MSGYQWDEHWIEPDDGGQIRKWWEWELGQDFQFSSKEIGRAHV